MKPRRILFYLTVIVLLLAVYSGWMLFGPTVKVPPSGFFYIHTGSSYGQVQDSLRKYNVFGAGFWFDRVARYVGYDHDVRPGRYRIARGMSTIDLVRMLRSGRQAPVNLVITKLRTREDLARKIGDDFETDSAAASRFLNSNDSLSSFGVDTNTVLTIVIPDTYTYLWNTPVSAILKKLAAGRNRFWDETRRQEAEALQLTPDQVYILASIVEEETNRNEDKGKIASVYLNRLNRHMKLAADPTIKFAMKDFALKRIYYKYLSYPSPYNTYLHEGLPPGPINTPSIRTLDAVLQEPRTDYLFFVARPNSGGLSDFSSSFREHEQFAKAYRDALDSAAAQKR